MNQLQSLKISLDSLLYDTEKIHSHLQNRSGSFDPGQVDLDCKLYCQQYNAIRDFTRNLPDGETITILKERMAELPDITEFDFRHEPSGFSLDVILPIVGEWLKDTLTTNGLREKMEDIYRGLNTIQFMLKGLTNSQVAD